MKFCEYWTGYIVLITRRILNFYRTEHFSQVEINKINYFYGRDLKTQFFS